jgi:hypothetical protein
MKDGSYYFDTDFTFGFDLVMEYDFTMKYLEPFNTIYKKYSRHKEFKRVFLDETTTWVRSYISPVFVMAATSMENVSTVFRLCDEFIKCWLTIYREAEKKDQDFKETQLKRIKARYGGMRQTDRMGKVLLKAYGQETFSQVFKAML